MEFPNICIEVKVAVVNAGNEVPWKDPGFIEKVCNFVKFAREASIFTEGAIPLTPAKYM